MSGWCAWAKLQRARGHSLAALPRWHSSTRAGLRRSSRERKGALPDTCWQWHTWETAGWLHAMAAWCARLAQTCLVWLPVGACRPSAWPHPANALSPPVIFPPVTRSLPPPRAQAVPLTRDHTADDLEERARLAAAGGACALRSGSWRVGAPGLQVSRSVGDADLKDQGVSAEAETAELVLTSQHHFIVAATDGLWEHVRCGKEGAAG